MSLRIAIGILLATAIASKPALAKPADHLVAVAFAVREDGEHGQVQHALEELTQVDRIGDHLRRAVYCGKQSSGSNIRTLCWTPHVPPPCHGLCRQ